MLRHHIATNEKGWLEAAVDEPVDVVLTSGETLSGVLRGSYRPSGTDHRPASAIQASHHECGEPGAEQPFAGAPRARHSRTRRNRTRRSKWTGMNSPPR